MSTKERDFENTIEDHLLNHGYLKGSPDDFDRVIALYPTHLFAYIEATQPNLWTRLRKQHGTNLEQAVLDSLVKRLESDGMLSVLRHGFKFLGDTIRVATFKPAHGLNEDLLQDYAANRLVITRQVKYIPDKEDSIDLVLFLNGLPIATAELKNPLTGQTYRHAIRQYKNDRDPRQKLLEFKKRALVHFAVDQSEVWMTTHLQKGTTWFLPFNKGNAGGKGNPENPDGYRTAYLWEEVWQRDSLLDILGRFVHLETTEMRRNGKKVKKEALIFPRYHQLDSVRRLEAAARSEGPGHNYLIQHSAGSGKSNSIAWLAYRLQDLHDAKDRKVFNSVIVVTDRLVLDKQLQDTIYQFEHKQGVVERIENHSGQLAEALTQGTPIIITTLQKFPFVAEKIGTLPDRTYAVIVDEAHSSQTGESAQKMKQILGDLEEAAKAEAGEETTYEDTINEVMASRGRQKNLSFFAFTATPKYRTLELFGQCGPDGKPEPFHLYTMRQAIEEKFILDVLQNYTTYKTFYRLNKAIEDDPEVDKKKAATALARYLSLHPHNVAQKTEVIVEHFRKAVRPKIWGKAKAMLVTASRLHAVRYKQSFDKYIREKGYTDVNTMVAFSGTVRDSGLDYTEPQMNNGVPEKGLPEEFNKLEGAILLVANKYQTGFDQPLLHTMYVDKRLAGVQAVQALSRLNRTHPGKEETFVLDFVNEAAEIQAAFQPYYEKTLVGEQADHHQLYDLQGWLDGTQVYFKSEVEAFAKAFYKRGATSTDQQTLYRNLDPARDRFQALEPDQQQEFRDKMGAYVRLYAFLSQIMGFMDADLEKLYSFLRYLARYLPRRQDEGPLRLEDDVELRYYRLQKQSEGAIDLVKGEGGTVSGPTDVGTGLVRDEKAPLSEIIDIVNERFGTSFIRADQLFFDSVIEDAKADEDVAEKARANPFDNFALALGAKIEEIMVQRIDSSQEIVTKYLDDNEFQQVVFREIARRLYQELRS
jgi:type I restriction enzyme R subunit